MPRLKALDHVGLKVRDLDRTLDFYRRLGLTVLRTKGPNAEGLRFAVLQVGSQELNVSSRPDFLQQGMDKGVGIDHFCFEVDAASIEDVIADLRTSGIEPDGGPLERRDGSAVFVTDPDGVKVELQLKKR
jgi:catechol 2,3-dioxygenase-like lactoylglutathione lyase family enzyme